MTVPSPPARTPRAPRAVLLLAACLLVLAPTAQATIYTPATAMDHAIAMAANPGPITGAAWVAYPPSGTPTGVSNAPVGPYMPTHGPDFSILTTGNADFADDPNSSGSTSADNSGGNVRGNSDYDVVILRVDFHVCTATNVSFDYQFLSEEFPEWTGSIYNDAFIAELDGSSWTTNSGAVTAPAPPAVVVESVGAATKNSAHSSGTTYDEGTALLTASTPVSPGSHSLYFSIFDQGDRIYDSAVFLDNLLIPDTCNPPCDPGHPDYPDCLPCDPGNPNYPECAPCDETNPEWPDCRPCAPGTPTWPECVPCELVLSIDGGCTPCEEGNPNYPECDPCQSGSPSWPECGPCPPDFTGPVCCDPLDGDCCEFVSTGCDPCEPTVQDCCTTISQDILNLDSGCRPCLWLPKSLYVLCEPPIEITVEQSQAARTYCTDVLDGCALEPGFGRPADAPVLRPDAGATPAPPAAPRLR